MTPISSLRVPHRVATPRRNSKAAPQMGKAGIPARGFFYILWFGEGCDLFSKSHKRHYGKRFKVFAQSKTGFWGASWFILQKANNYTPCPAPPLLAVTMRRRDAPDTRCRIREGRFAQAQSVGLRTRRKRRSNAVTMASRCARLPAPITFHTAPFRGSPLE